MRESARLASMRKYDGDFGQDRINVPIVAHNTFSRRVIPSFIVDVIFGEVSGSLLNGNKISSEKIIARGFNFEHKSIKKLLH